MVRILTKKAFRFTKPLSEGSISRPRSTETPEEAAQRLARDAAQALSNMTAIKKQSDHTFDVQPNVTTNCPDWIKLDAMFEWGVKDGDIMELVTPQMAAVAAAASGTKAPVTLTEHHVKFLQSRGYPQKDVTEAQEFFEGMNDAHQASFLVEAEAWKPEEPEAEKLGPVDLSKEGANAALPPAPAPEEEKLGPVADPPKPEDGNAAGSELPPVPGGPSRRRRVVGGGQ